MKKIPMTQHPKETVVKDNFGHTFKTTINNLIISILFFIILLAPFIIIGLAIFNFHDNRIIHFMEFLLKFFSIWAIFFLIVIPGLVLLNNHRTHHIYHKKITHDVNKLNKRKYWLYTYYYSKFGDHLLNWKIYTVNKNNNIPVDYILKHYKEMKQ